MRKPAFTLEQLRSFVAVAESEHISRAASTLFLTQAAVTQQVRHFERAVGLQLLERHGRSVRLTDAGRSLAEACRAALRAIEVMDEAAHAMKELQAGSLHVGANPTSAAYYLPQYLAEFARRNPGIKLNMTVEPSSELKRRVLTGSLDCAVVAGAPDRDLVAFELARDEVVLVAHRDHPLSRLKRVSPADITKHRYLGRKPRQTGGRTIRQMLGEAYDQVDALDLAHPAYVRAAAMAGLGFAALPKLAVASDLEAGVLKPLPVPPVVRSIFAVRRKARGGPAQEAFWELLTGARMAASARISSDGAGKS